MIVVKYNMNEKKWLKYEQKYVQKTVEIAKKKKKYQRN